MDINENNVINEPILGETKKKKSILPFLIIVVIIFVAIGGGYYYFTNQVIATNGDDFINLLTKNQHFITMIEEPKELVTNNEVNANVVFKSIVDDENTLEEICKADLNLLSNGENYNATMNLELPEILKLDMEFVKEGDVVALSVPKLYNNFVAISKTDLPQFVAKLGYNMNDITTTEDYKNAYDELLKLIDEYGPDVAEVISKYIEIENDKEVEVNGKTYQAQQYKLKLGQKGLNNLGVKVFEKLKDDEYMLLFLASYMMESGYYYETLNDAYVDVKNSIKEMYEDFVTKSQDGSIDDSTVLEINLYSVNGKNVKTEINILEENTQIILESASDEKEDYIGLIVEVAEENMAVTYNADKNQNNYDGKIGITMDEVEGIVLEFNIDKIENTSKVLKTINELDKIMLNDATDEELMEILNQIELNSSNVLVNEENASIE